MKYLSLILVFLSCTTMVKKEMTEEQKEALTIKRLKFIRPILKSDDFQFMKCEEVGEFEHKTDEDINEEFWKVFGTTELRNHELAAKANIMFLKHGKFGKIHSFKANYFKCNTVVNAKETGDVGMCKASKEKIFTIKLNRQVSQDIAKELMKQKIRYYAINNYYKTYSFRNFKYSFTKKEYSAESSLYKCY